MILQALTDYYEVLKSAGKVPPLGWDLIKISFVLYLKADGTLERVIDIRDVETRGKKNVYVPLTMTLPVSIKGTSDISPNFLWDNAGYLLGIDSTGKERTVACFEATKKQYIRILKDVSSPAAEMLLEFYRNWDVTKAKQNAVLKEYWEDIIAGGNLTFRHDGGFFHEDEEIIKAWNREFADSSDAAEMVCLVTGKKGPVVKTHPYIKNLPNTSKGVSLVSFNKEAFWSYGKRQSYNAPTSKYAAYAYTSTLNHLLGERKYTKQMGDTTVVWWAKGGGNGYQLIFSYITSFEQPSYYDENDIRSVILKLCKGKYVEFQNERLDPNMEFFILGLEPNNGRVMVRFFYRNSFGDFLNNVQAHSERIAIQTQNKVIYKDFSIKKLLLGTVREEKDIRSGQYRDMLHSILLNLPYPKWLHDGTLRRICINQSITDEQAAAIKANIRKNYQNQSNYLQLLEVADVQLNDSCTYLPYVLGRLFAVMEKIQCASANWDINRTIKDAYFNSVTMSPELIFSKLFSLNEHHMKKLMRDKPGLGKTYGREKQEILDKIKEPIPRRFRQDEIDCFYIGYYHQMNKTKEE